MDKNINSIDDFLALNAEEAEKYIVDLLAKDSFYPKKEDELKLIAFHSLCFINNYFLRDENHPIITKFNDRAYFKPHANLIKREGLLNAKIKYAAHFVTREENKLRLFDSSKSQNINHLFECLINPDERLIDSKDKSKIYYLKEVAVIEKSKGILRSFVAVMKIDIDKKGNIVVITVMPNKSTSWAENKKSRNELLDSPLLFSPLPEGLNSQATETNSEFIGTNIESESKTNISENIENKNIEPKKFSKGGQIMETTEQKISKLEKAITSPATPENVKVVMKEALEKLKVEVNPDVISKTLNLIKEQIGLDLKLDDYFTGLKKHNGEIYFNVDLGERVSESSKFDKLKRFADKYNLIRVEPNGVNKVSIFPKEISEITEDKIEQKYFTFLKDNPKVQARALTALSKKFMRKGNVMTGYEIIESLPKGLEVKVIKLHSKNEKGFTEKTVIGDFITESKAEVDYYNYLGKGGFPYSEFLKESERVKKIENEKRLDEQKKATEEKESKDREVFAREKQRKLDHIKYILEGGETTIGAKQLELLKRMYHLENGELIKSNDWKVGDEVYVLSDKDATKEILTKIIDIKDGSGYLDNEPRYVVQKNDEIYNEYKGYDTLLPAQKEEEKELQKGIELEQEKKDESDKYFGNNFVFSNRIKDLVIIFFKSKNWDYKNEILKGNEIHSFIFTKSPELDFTFYSEVKIIKIEGNIHVIGFIQASDENYKAYSPINHEFIDGKVDFSLFTKMLNDSYKEFEDDFKYKSELQKGIEVEQEHKDTLEGVAAGEITVPEAIKETAEEHIKENPNYYDELEKIESGHKNDTEKVKKAMQVQFDLIKAEIDKGKLKDKKTIHYAQAYIETLLKESPSAYPFYVDKYLELPKSVRDILNPFFGMFEGEHPSTMKWLKEQGKNVFDVVKVEEYSLPKTKVIQTKPDDKNFMDIHSDFTGNDELRPVMMGTHFDENGVVSTNAHLMLITPYRGDVAKLEGNFCHTKKCIEENKENKDSVTNGKFPNWQYVIPKSNTEYNMNTAAVYDFIKNSTNYELMNAVTNTLVFKYGEEKIGFNARFLIICINAMSELGHKELSIAIGTSNRAALIIPKGRLQDVNNLKTDFALLMPMMLDTVVEYYGEFNLENSCYTDPNELTYCFDVEKVKVKKAEKKVKELEKKIEELTSAIEPMIKEKEFPSPEKQGMFKVIKGIFEGTEFFGRIDGDRVINEDSIGQSFPIANVKRIGYELGEGWSADFDFEGLLKTALRANTSWGVEALKKLHYSFEDNNYHTLGRPLWEAVKSLQLGAEPSAKIHLHEFHQDVQEELNDYLTPDVEQEEIDPNTLQPIAKEEVGEEPINPVEAITDAVEDNDKASWEELKELAEAMIEVSKGKEKKEWIETKELAELMLAE